MTRVAPCVVIGWDGATFDLLQPWVEQGFLPNLAEMLAAGSARRLRAVIPPVSPACWASILTGMNPAKHGIMDFQEFNPSDYVSQQPGLVNSTHMAGATLLDLLTERGVETCALQLPTTYPVWPIRGLMLAGIPNPDDSKCYTHPPGRDFGPLRPSKMQKKMTYRELLENCTFHIHKLTDIFREVVAENYDCYWVYYRECDDFHHWYWRLLDEKCAGYDAADREQMGNPILTIYQLLDAELHRLREALPDANFFLISDHGGTAIGRRRFYLNSWLAERGYLKLQSSWQGTAQRIAYRALRRIKPWIPTHLRRNLLNEKPRLARAFARVRNNTDAIAWDRSRAFAVQLASPTCGVQVNLRGRERQGIIEPGAEYEQFRTELMADLKTIIDPGTGGPLVKEIFRREERFSGPYLNRIPDIVMQYNPGVLMRTEIGMGLWSQTPENELIELSGDHDMNGIFVAAGPAIRRAGFLPEATLLDVAPSLLCSLAQPVPESMDGRVLEDIFQPAFLSSHPPVVAGACEVMARTAENVYSAEEEEAIRKRLEDLGYLGE